MALSKQKAQDKLYNSMKKTDKSIKNTQGIQLNKYIAHAGLCSRRKAQEVIESGAILVNNTPVTQSGYRVQPGDRVTYNERVLSEQKKVVILLNKPSGYITTVSDEENRKTVLDLIHLNTCDRLYPVGRLDKLTTGVLLITNDGELAHALAHPRYVREKVYHVQLATPLSPEHLRALAQGIRLSDGFIQPDKLAYISRDRKHVKIILHSGKNRIIRRLFEHFNYNVEQLDRVEYAGLGYDQLKRGHWRFLTQQEITMLKQKH